MDNVYIRECTVKDLDEVLTLQHLWEKENITYGFSAADREYLRSKLGKYFLIAEKDTKIVGFIYGTIHKAKDMAIFHNGELYIEIDDIYILSDFRGKGIGNYLLDELLSTAKINGIERSMIYSSTKDMDNIIQFYKKHGYKTWNVQMFK